MIGVCPSCGQKGISRAKLVLLEGVAALGALALAGPYGELTAEERRDLKESLFECLELLNNEKE